jgi:hypothetical protein
MKTINSKIVLAALVFGAAVTSAQANESRWLWPEDKPQPMMLAESGSDRLMDYRQYQEALTSQRNRSDSGERFVEMVKERPTAAGAASEEQAEQLDKPKPMYRPPIQRDRELYGK